MESEETSSAAAPDVTDEELVSLYKIALARVLPLIRARYGFTHDQAAEAISQTFESLISHLRHAEPSINNPTAYMYAIAFRTAARLGRTGNIRRAREVTAGTTLTEDDFGLSFSDSQAAAAIDSAATVTTVRQILRELVESGDDAAFRVLTYMLDGIQVIGEVPSNREIGRACGLSHTGVAKVLLRLRPSFQDFWSLE